MRTQFLMEGPCINCGSKENLEVHHVRRLSSDKKVFSTTERALNSKLNRKQVVLCRKCHLDIHTNRYDGKKL